MFKRLWLRQASIPFIRQATLQVFTAIGTAS
jgi:hypothetical protein